MFFNEQGMLNLDEAVMNQPTFKKIMEDGIVLFHRLQYRNNSFRLFLDLLFRDRKSVV